MILMEINRNFYLKMSKNEEALEFELMVCIVINLCLVSLFKANSGDIRKECNIFNFLFLLKFLHF